MCLIIAVRVPYERGGELEHALRPPNDAKIEVLLPGDRRWFVARWLGPPTEREAEFVLEEAGCGCGFISEQAPTSPDVWPMTAEHRERLANAVARFVSSIPGDVRFTAMWVSDPVRTTRYVTLGELVEAVRGGDLGTHTEYRVAAPPAS